MSALTLKTGTRLKLKPIEEVAKHFYGNFPTSRQLDNLKLTSYIKNLIEQKNNIVFLGKDPNYDTLFHVSNTEGLPWRFYKDDIKGIFTIIKNNIKVNTRKLY